MKYYSKLKKEMLEIRKLTDVDVDIRPKEKFSCVWREKLIPKATARTFFYAFLICESSE